MPLIGVDGVGPIALPLLSAQAAQLIAVAEPAPYGRGGEALLDTAVRRNWQIGAAASTAKACAASCKAPARRGPALQGARS